MEPLQINSKTLRNEFETPKILENFKYTINSKWKCLTTNPSKRSLAEHPLVSEINIENIILSTNNPTHQTWAKNKLFLSRKLKNFFFFLFSNDDVVKAGGMRIVQHKNPNTERAAKGEQVEVIGLSQNNPIDSVTLSSSPTQKIVTVESSQAAHGFKPAERAESVPHKPLHNINQPRK